MSIVRDAIETLSQDYLLETHLQANFYPALPSHAFDVAKDAIDKYKEGEANDEVVEVIDALYLWVFIEE